jgi:hypothetical protein
MGTARPPSANGWARNPSRIRGGELGVMAVLVVGRHVALPRGFRRFSVVHLYQDYQQAHPLL